MPDEKEEQELSEGDISSLGNKHYIPKWVSVNIKKVDGHFIVSFQHGPERVFHNMQELLTAIEVEAGKLDPGPQY